MASYDLPKYRCALLWADAGIACSACKEETITLEAPKCSICAKVRWYCATRRRCVGDPEKRMGSSDYWYRELTSNGIVFQDEKTPKFRRSMESNMAARYIVVNWEGLYMAV